MAAMASLLHPPLTPGGLSATLFHADLSSHLPLAQVTILLAALGPGGPSSPLPCPLGCRAHTLSVGPPRPGTLASEKGVTLGVWV